MTAIPTIHVHKPQTSNKHNKNNKGQNMHIKQEINAKDIFTPTKGILNVLKSCIQL